MTEEKLKQEASKSSSDQPQFQEINYYDQKIKQEDFGHNLKEFLHHSIDIKEENEVVEENKDLETLEQSPRALLIDRTYQEPKVWICSICFYQTLEKSDSERHLKTHTKKVFTCKPCNLKFSFKSRYQQHLRRHVGDKQFVTFEMIKLLKK